MAGELESLTVGVPNLISLASLTDVDAGTPITTATVTHRLDTADGVAVTGETARACVHSTGGTYTATIPSTAPLTAGSAYRGTYTVDVGGQVSTFAVRYIAIAATA